MPRPGEQVRVLETMILPLLEGNFESWKTHNDWVREQAQICQNVDRGFAHYIGHFKPDQPVEASFGIEKGVNGDYGWGVHFPQGRHRCVLAGVLSRRPESEI
jgi:hypothetical protein